MKSFPTNASFVYSQHITECSDVNGTRDINEAEVLRGF